MNAWVSVIFALCIAFLLPLNFDSHDLKGDTQKMPNRFRSPFRYAIVGNEIVNPTGHPEDAFRYVVILLDGKAFSEDTLRSLFKLVSSRFPAPRRLDVQVNTSLEQVETPEEHEQGKVSESSGDTNMDKYHWVFSFARRTMNYFDITRNRQIAQ